MIYITQLIFVWAGKEEVFQQFEDFVIPLIATHRGTLLYRVRPTPASFVSGDAERPYEIHFVSFPSEADLEAFMKDDRRLTYIHLKEASVTSTLIVKGEKM